MFDNERRITELENRFSELENNIGQRIYKLVNDLNALIQRSHTEIIDLFDNRDKLLKKFKSEINNIIHAVSPLVRENILKEEYNLEKQFHKAELNQKLPH